jgi:hypothetical protein
VSTFLGLAFIGFVFWVLYSVLHKPLYTYLRICEWPGALLACCLGRRYRRQVTGILRRRQLAARAARLLSASPEKARVPGPVTAGLLARGPGIPTPRLDAQRAASPGSPVPAWAAGESAVPGRREPGRVVYTADPDRDAEAVRRAEATVHEITDRDYNRSEGRDWRDRLPARSPWAGQVGAEESEPLGELYPPDPDLDAEAADRDARMYVQAVRRGQMSADEARARMYASTVSGLAEALAGASRAIGQNAALCAQAAAQLEGEPSRASLSGRSGRVAPGGRVASEDEQWAKVEANWKDTW